MAQQRKSRTITARAPSAASASSIASEHALLPLGALMLAASVSSWAQTAPEATMGTVTVKEAAEVQSKDTIQTKKTASAAPTRTSATFPNR